MRSRRSRSISSALLDRARHEPVSAGDADPDEERLARLERTGVIRRARHGRLEEMGRIASPAPEPGGDIVAAVLEERRNGR